MNVTRGTALHRFQQSLRRFIVRLHADDDGFARSHECDYPATVRDLPAVTAPKFNPDGRSYQIDQRVKAILQEAGAGWVERASMSA